MTLVEVELLARVHRPTGGSWNPGEIAAFPTDEAAGLVRRGLARLARKSLDGPPVDRAMKGAPVKKGV